jgi:hypothetical protein
MIFYRIEARRIVEHWMQLDAAADCPSERSPSTASLT